MKHFLRFVLIGCLGLIIWGCLEEIDLEVDPEFQDNVVIQGSFVIGDPSVVHVRVTKLFDFTSNGREALSVRRVSLFDEDGNQVELETGDAVGDYTLEIPRNDPNFSVSPEKSYYVEINTFDGRTFRSTPERAPTVPEAKELTPRIILIDEFGADGTPRPQEYVEFLLDTELENNEEGTFLRWISERTFRSTDEAISDLYTEPKTCYITERAPVSFLPVASSELFTGEIQEFPVFQERIGFRFSEGYYLTVFQQSLTREAHRYWSNVASLINRDGTIFEPPVGQVPSNISNVDDPEDETFGFFYATQQDTIRLYISPEYAGNPRQYCPVIFNNVPPGFDYCETVSVCCDCLTAPRSQLERPEFWVE
jgi:hypothetical protein